MLAASGCPTPDQLRALLDGSLPEAEQTSLNRHIDACESCQRTLESLVAGKESWDGIARRLANADGPATPALADAMASAKQSADTISSGGHAATDADLPLNFLQPSDQPDSLGRLGPYEILQVIGRGGFGVVLKALDTSLRRIVAIKVLSPSLAANASARRRFVREARAAAAVVHEHVVAIHAVADQHEPPYLVMQYIEGKTLQDRLDQSGPLAVREVLRIGMQTAAGLAAAHAQGLVHRDIKPSNILLENGVERVKLTDFGLARAMDDASVTQSGVIAGTPQYMSPEQARGEMVDHRSDLFSLGCVLYAMCVGHAPFRASTTMGVLKRVCDDSPRPIRELNPDIPDWLIRLVGKLMSKNPADRFQTAREVADVLGQSLVQLQQPQSTSLLLEAARAPMPSGLGSSPNTETSRRLAAQEKLAFTAMQLPALGLFIVFAVIAVIGKMHWQEYVIANLVLALWVLFVRWIARHSREITHGGLTGAESDRLSETHHPAAASSTSSPLLKRRRWKYALTAAVIAFCAWWFVPSLVLMSRNQGRIVVALQDSEAKFVLRRDGQEIEYYRSGGGWAARWSGERRLPVTTPTNDETAMIDLVPGTYRLEIIPPLGKEVRQFAYFHETPLTGRYVPSNPTTEMELNVGRGDSLKLTAAFTDSPPLDLNGAWNTASWPAEVMRTAVPGMMLVLVVCLLIAGIVIGVRRVVRGFDATTPAEIEPESMPSKEQADSWLSRVPRAAWVGLALMLSVYVVALFELQGEIPSSAAKALGSVLLAASVIYLAAWGAIALLIRSLRGPDPGPKLEPRPWRIVMFFSLLTIFTIPWVLKWVRDPEMHIRAVLLSDDFPTKETLQPIVDTSLFAMSMLFLLVGVSVGLSHAVRGVRANSAGRRRWGAALFGIAFAVFCNLLILAYALNFADRLHERNKPIAAAHLTFKLAGPHIEVIVNGEKVPVSASGQVDLNLVAGEYVIAKMKNGRPEVRSGETLHAGEFKIVGVDESEADEIRITGPLVMSYGPGASAPNAADYIQLQGRWTIVSEERDGELVTAPQRGKWIEFDRGTMRWDVPDSPRFPVFPTESRVAIYAAIHPGQIDILNFRASGIYQLDGDKLTLAIADPDKPRPTEFVSRPASAVTLTVCRRALVATETTPHTTVAQPPAANSRETAELDRLVELAEQNLQRVRALVERKAESTTAADDAEVKVIEARVRRGKARGDQAEVVSQLRRLVEIRETTKARIDTLAKSGAAAASDVADAEARFLDAKVQLNDAETALAMSSLPTQGIAWGPTSPKGMQLGIQFDPRQDEYRVGDVIKLKLTLRNAGQADLATTLPRLDVLEKLDLDLLLHDDSAQRLPRKWGRAHKARDLFTVSGGMGITLRPGGTHELPPAEIVIGTGDDSPTATAHLDVRPGQACRLVAKLGTYGYAMGEGEPLMSGAITFRAVAGDARPVREILVDEAGVWNLVVSRDGRFLAALAANGAVGSKVKVWDAVSLAERLSFTDERTIHDLVCLPDLAGFVTCDSDHHIRRREWATGRAVTEFERFPDPTLALDINNTGDALVSGGADMIVRVWNLETNQVRKILAGATSPIISVAISADGKTAAAGCENGHILVWDVATAERRHLWTHFDKKTTGISISPDGRHVAGASWNHLACVFDLDSDFPTKFLKAHTGHVRTIAWSPDGQRLATASSDGTVIVWDANKADRLATFNAKANQCYDAVFIDGGRSLATAHRDGIIRVWDVSHLPSEPAKSTP